MLLSGEGVQKYIFYYWHEDSTVGVQKDGQNYLPIRANVFFVIFQNSPKLGFLILSLAICAK